MSLIRVTKRGRSNTPSNESQIAWAPDSRKLAYVSDRDGPPHVYLYDFASNTETQLTRDAADDATPGFSPDGKWLAFERDARELRVIDFDSKQERLLASGTFNLAPLSSSRPFVWSPDNKWLTVMKQPAKTAAILKLTDKSKTVLIKGGGNFDYLCGECETILMEGVQQDKCLGLVLLCNKCGSFNVTLLRTNGPQ